MWLAQLLKNLQNMAPGAAANAGSSGAGGLQAATGGGGAATGPNATSGGPAGNQTQGLVNYIN